MKNIKSADEAKKIFIEYLKKNNLKVTHERTRLVEEIFKIKDHFDAEGLFFQFKKEHINISRATIYRTLELLVESGLLIKIRFSDNTNHYEHIFGQQYHSHIICRNCGKIEEFVDERINKITQQIASQFDYVDYKHNFRIYGICKECRKKKVK